MKQVFFDFKINTSGQKLYKFTDQVVDWIEKKNLKKTLEFSHQTETFFFLARKKKAAACSISHIH